MLKNIFKSILCGFILSLLGEIVIQISYHADRFDILPISVLILMLVHILLGHAYIQNKTSALTSYISFILFCIVFLFFWPITSGVDDLGLGFLFMFFSIPYFISVSLITLILFKCAK